MPSKTRSQEEVDQILKDVSEQIPFIEICRKYDLSESVLRTIIRTQRGGPADTYQLKRQRKTEKLEKLLQQREKEIELLKRALKKS